MFHAYNSNCVHLILTVPTQSEWGWRIKPHCPGSLCPNSDGTNPSRSLWQVMKPGNKQRTVLNIKQQLFNVATLTEDNDSVMSLPNQWRHSDIVSHRQPDLLKKLFKLL